MERLHAPHYVALFYDLEIGSPEKIRESAEGVLHALEDPAIAAYSSEPVYVAQLEETRKVAEQIIWQSMEKDRGPLIALRARLSRSCQSCHESQRR